MVSELFLIEWKSYNYYKDNNSTHANTPRGKWYFFHTSLSHTNKQGYFTDFQLMRMFLYIIMDSIFWSVGQNTNYM